MALQHFLLLILISFLGAEAKIREITNLREVTIVNKCNTTIWPGFILATGQVNEEGFELKPEESGIIKFNVGVALIWGRKGCSFDPSGRGNCTSGDCGGLLRCVKQHFPVPPVTLVSLFLNIEMDMYGISLAGGFNIPISILPYGNSSNECKSVSCNSDLNKACPEELQVRVNGRTVACKSECLAFKTPEFCCIGNGGYGTSKTCRITNSSRVFKETCPTATVHGYGQEMFTCYRSNYLIRFC
ncbi:hypothetical protein JCGZ_01299 [Jatropha curcas]|uniref:Thaumatin-like protein n=1 Tax=Jatropha curcas TaxID=180498 RepID=A0A067LKF6_JATCU|nr:pathogenesis-related thaumatin-like protein 3.5 [Jatropha curcas]KDP44799.1 hypothetical protein JCGZ_01299 [Jatropha curcas]